MAQYDIQTVRKNISFDIIDLYDECDRKAKVYDVLLAIAAPCTRLDYNNTPADQLSRIMRDVKLFMDRRKSSLSVYTREALKNILDEEWLINQEEIWLLSYLKDFKLIKDVDENDCVILDEKLEAAYRKMKSSPYVSVEYHSLKGSSQSGTYPDKPIGEGPFQTFKAELIDGWCTYGSCISADQWYQIIKDSTPSTKLFLAYFIEMPDYTASCSEVQEKFGMNQDIVNILNTKLGKRAERFMGNFENVDEEGQSRFWSIPMKRGQKDPARGFIWEMRTELVEAALKFKAEGGLPEVL